MSRILLLLIIVSLPNLSFATVSQFCFPSNISLTDVKNYIEAFTVTMDTVKYGKNNCIQIESRPDRVGLLGKLLRNKFPRVQEVSGSPTPAVTTRRKPIPCTLILTEERIKRIDGENRELGKRVDISNSNERLKSTNKNFISTLEGKVSTLRARDNDYSFTCTLRGKNMEIELFKFGTDGSISTTIELVPGQKQEIGAALEDIDEKNREVGIPKGYKKNIKKGSDNTRYYLEIK